MHGSRALSCLTQFRLEMLKACNSFEFFLFTGNKYPGLYRQLKRRKHPLAIKKPRTLELLPQLGAHLIQYLQHTLLLHGLTGHTQLYLFIQ